MRICQHKKFFQVKFLQLRRTAPLLSGLWSFPNSSSFQICLRKTADFVIDKLCINNCHNLREYMVGPVGQDSLRRVVMSERSWSFSTSCWCRHVGKRLRVRFCNFSFSLTGKMLFRFRHSPCLDRGAKWRYRAAELHEKIVWHHRTSSDKLQFLLASLGLLSPKKIFWTLPLECFASRHVELASSKTKGIFHSPLSWG